VKKILMLCTALLLTLGLVGAGTFAHFSDTETSIGNAFTAGTLDLVVTGGPLPAPPGPPLGVAMWAPVPGQQAVFFTLTNIAPGTNSSATFNLTNVGSLAGFVDLHNVTVQNFPGVTPEPEPQPDAGELGANLWISVTLGTVHVYTGMLNGFPVHHDLNVSLGASGFTSLVIHWGVPAAVGNIIQGDIATLNITFELAQTPGQ
jgi:predicted ribosomally synthesized peptide with SipW-like signal peptide